MVYKVITDYFKKDSINYEILNGTELNEFTKFIFFEGMLIEQNDYIQTADYLFDLKSNKNIEIIKSGEVNYLDHSTKFACFVNFILYRNIDDIDSCNFLACMEIGRDRKYG